MSDETIPVNIEILESLIQAAYDISLEWESASYKSELGSSETHRDLVVCFQRLHEDCGEITPDRWKEFEQYVGRFQQ